MAFALPKLPYAYNALEPHLSAETLKYHYDEHHKGYVDKLNELTKGTDQEKKALEDIIKSAEGNLFNQAAQVWNHTFYWHSLNPKCGGKPQGVLADAINDSFGSFDKFKETFNAKAASNFGSGWTWLVQRDDGKLDIINTDDADTPIAGDTHVPLLTVDVWEHAYYIDYRHARPKYLEAVWNIVNWEFAHANFEHPEAVTTQFRFAA